MRVTLATAVLFCAAIGLGAQAPDFAKISKQADDARQKNQLDQAVDLYRRALELKPDWKEGWWFLGTLQYDRDRYPEARDALQQLAALDPSNASAFALLGLCEYQTKQYEPSLGHLNRARQIGLKGIGPQMIQVVMYHTAILLTRFGEYEAAMQALLELVKQGNSGPRIIEAAGLAALRKPILPSDLPSQDRELVFLTGRAVCSATERHGEEAQKAFESILSGYPNAPNVHYTYGAWLLMNDPDSALKEFEKELAIDPKHLPALVAIALEYVKRGEPEKGREYAERAVKYVPSSFASHAALGRILVETDKLAEGIKELEIAERMAPESPQVRIALATAYGRAGRTADAARERAEFLKLKAASEKP